MTETENCAEFVFGNPGEENKQNDEARKKVR